MTALSGQSLSYNCAEPVHGTLLAAGRSRHAALVALARDRLAEFG
jgi:myo-inositol-1(or 4)-monophosphatase